MSVLGDESSFTALEEDGNNVQESSTTLVGFETAKTISKNEKDRIRPFSVDDTTLTRCLLNGGLSPGTIAEVVGQAGMGKTQICLTVSITAQFPSDFGGLNAEVIYVDTEGSFSTKRLQEMAYYLIRYAKNRRSVASNVPSFDKLLQGIRVVRCHDFTELRSAMHQLQNVIASRQGRVRAVIVDSIAFHMRQDFEDPSERNVALHEFAVILSRVAAENIADEGSYMASALGPSWPHRCTNRIWLYKDEMGGRTAHMFKSSYLPETSVKYTIQDQLFDDFRMEGLSPENNEILLEVCPEELARVIKSAVSARHIKIKLTKKENVPHLTFEIKPASSNTSSKPLVVQDIPVTVVSHRHWGDYEKPNVSRIKVAFTLPPARALQRVVGGMRNMGAKHVKLLANNAGEFNVDVMTDACDVTAYYTDLNNITLAVDPAQHNGNDDEFALHDNEGDDSPRPPRRAPGDHTKVMHSVCVDIKALSNFLAHQQLTFGRLMLSIAPNRCALFSIEQDDMLLHYILPGMIL